MEREPGSEIRDGIAKALDRGAMLLVRHVARSTSLTAKAVMRALRHDGPARLTELECSTGVRHPAMTPLVGRMDRDRVVVRLIDPEDARGTLSEITAAEP